MSLNLSNHTKHILQMHQTKNTTCYENSLTTQKNQTSKTNLLNQPQNFLNTIQHTFITPQFPPKFSTPPLNFPSPPNWNPMPPPVERRRHKLTEKSHSSALNIHYVFAARTDDGFHGALVSIKRRDLEKREKEKPTMGGKPPIVPLTFCEESRFRSAGDQIRKCLTFRNLLIFYLRFFIYKIRFMYIFRFFWIVKQFWTYMII